MSKNVKLKNLCISEATYLLIRMSMVSLILTFISCQHYHDAGENGVVGETHASIKEYQGPHAAHHEKFSKYPFTLEAQWDSLNGFSPHPVPALQYEVHPDYKTFGWHLYSKGSTYLSYNFALLWGVAYFSYFVDPETGGYQNIHQWKTTALVDSAQAHDCKVFLAISNFGAHNNALFLDHPKSQKLLADSICALIQYRNANGVNVDFEGIPGTHRHAYSDFISLLSHKLKAMDPALMVSVALYAVDYNHVFDIPSMDPFVDFYTLMAYDYHGGFSTYAGPVSPLQGSTTWGDHCIETSVDYYLTLGVNRDKLIVGLPYYGAEWVTDDTHIPSRADRFYSHPTYSDIQHVYLDSLGILANYDTTSATRYFTFSDTAGYLRQVWFDDQVSLGQKYDWIKRNHLCGAGVWALGFDHGDTELWELMGNTFGRKR